MSDLAEDRVYSDKLPPYTLVLAGSIGVVSVEIVTDRVGTMRLWFKCTAHGLATVDNEIAVATDTDVFVSTSGEFKGTGFGPAVMVGNHQGTLIAASAAGAIKRYTDSWTPIGTTNATVTAMTNGFIGTEHGVYAISDSLTKTGLSAVNDVSNETIPMVATDDGLFELGNGWIQRLPGSFHMVQEHPRGSTLAHAATNTKCYERTTNWAQLSLPATDRITDATFTDRPVLITESGTLLVHDSDDWRRHELGIENVTAIFAIEPSPNAPTG